ncbi:fibronectin type III-like domain-contianing protein [Rouxiella chamberiensis]|uniref:Fibronectin type III-like domain-contianing protein n=1 Tax=Rouxiella chamberiensis TaxID=1513468 RepID=A0ABY7HUU0_9GAMM|nr:fibronectin type III-like domain-contianing protein [Rouxiella chamberiensis]WAT02576.1 fibronectin type III-like domain-contianing protein [Rouxiella chamberiensis]
MTFPADDSQLPQPEQVDPETTTSLPGSPVKGGIIHVDYNVEGSDVGYRWYARQKLTPRFPFGFGLSYTTFDYADLQVEEKDAVIQARLTVKNSGERAGAEVVQIYIQPQDGRYVPRLAAFERVELEAGESRDITLTLEPRVIASWDSTRSGWAIKGGHYQIRAAKNAEDAGLAAGLDLKAREFGY